MIKIAVCEDDNDDLLYLLSLIEEYRTTISLVPEICCSAFSCGDQFLCSIEHGSNFDIAFFDILMPGIDGIDTARELRQIDDGTFIIFMSSSKDFALDAYSVRAHDYIVKPILKDRLFSLLDEVINESLNHLNRYIILHQSTKLSKIFFHKIRYIEVIGRHLYFYITDGSIFKTVETLENVGKSLLSDPRFLKPHRSYIVNMDYIYAINSREICMQDKVKIPVPKNSFAQMKDQFINYCIHSK
ncbi:MAG: LytTR family DNA-binding domain-containing protein [Clostridia bacterium]